MGTGAKIHPRSLGIIFGMKKPLYISLWLAVWIAVSSTNARGCGKYEFLCADQQYGERCISSIDVCDGEKTCPDGSDETFELCASFGEKCRRYSHLFACDYGACIEKVRRCDSNIDCIDGSDEKGCPRPGAPYVVSRCSSSQFTCNSGACAAQTEVCDGVANCEDGSDETLAQCSQMSCPRYSFQCDYGACVDLDAKCNNMTDCVDGSDERMCDANVPEANKIAQQAAPEYYTYNTCSFPTHENTTYRLACKYPKSPECENSAGKPVRQNAAVIASCQPGFALPITRKTRPYMVCDGTNFDSTITCQKMCPPIVSEFHNVECTLNGTTVPCNKSMYSGTVAKISCKEHFVPHSTLAFVENIYCHLDGSWSFSLFRCIPDCGRALTTEHEKVAYGSNVTAGQAPWYAGFWDLTTGKHFCGGTLIAPHLIISAAHCFEPFIRKDFGTDDITQIQVIVGKLNINITKRGEHEQRIMIKSITEPKGYIGRPRFEKDLAVVELLGNLKLNNYTIPACVDWKKEGFFSRGTQGYIVGFGKNEYHQPSETLQAAALSFIDKKECDKMVRNTTSGTRQGISWDQFCAGAGGVQNNKPGVTSVQPGDSGGGFTFKRSGKYYLYGALSNHLNNEDNYAVYTNLAEHIDWLKDNNFHETLV